MATTNPNATPTVSPPRRRLRKRWILLATFLAIPLFAGWMIFREVPLAVMCLPDGRSFTIHKLTYGTEHHYRAAPAALTPAEAWVNQWLERIGRQIVVSHGGGNFSNYTPSVAVWHSFDWSNKTPESTPQWIVLTDSHGWRTSMSTLHLQNAPPPGIARQPTTPPWAAFALPSPSPELKVELLNAKGDPLASVRLPYDVPKALQQQWTAQSLPVNETDGNMSVTLKGLHADWVKVEQPGEPTVSDALVVTPEYTIAVDGMDSPSWTPMTEGVPFFENFGANQIAAAVLLPQGTSAPLTHCTMSPHESLWKLHLPFICRNPDEVTAPDRASLGRIAFNGQPSAVAETPTAVTVGKSDVRLLGAGRAGSFVYEGAGEANYAMPAQPIEYWTGNRLKGTIQVTHATGNYSVSTVLTTATSGQIVRQAQIPMTIGLKFTSPRPHVVISLDATGDRFPFMIVKDENGRLLEGELFNAQGLLIWLAKNAYDDVQEVDVTLLLQKPRVFTFIVPPPNAPPRPASASNTDVRRGS